MAVTHEKDFDEKYLGSDSVEVKALSVVNESFSLKYLGSDDRDTKTLNAPIQDLSDKYLGSDDNSNATLNAPIQDLSDKYLGSDSEGNHVTTTWPENLSDKYLGSDDFNVIGYSQPKIKSSNPSDGATTYSFYPEFNVTVGSETPVTVIFELYDDTPDSEGGKQLINSWGKFDAENQGNNQWYCSYKITEDLDQYLLPGTYNLLIKVENQSPEGYNYAEQWNKFYISKATVEVNFENLEYLIEENRLRFTFKIRHLNEFWVSLYNLLISEYLNKPFTIIDVDYPEYVLRDNTIILKTYSDWTYLKVVVQYNVKAELIDMANTLKQSKVEIANKIIIEDVISGKSYDLTRYFKNISYSRSMDLGASQAKIDFVIENGLSPFINTDTPLFYGNKVTIYSYLENVEYLEWQGYITEIETSTKGITITAFDKLVNFNNKLANDVFYSPETRVVKETLKAIDGVRFRGNYDSWVQSYRPKVWSAGTLLKAEEYSVDYYRGEVYVMKNPYLHPNYLDRTYQADDIDGRQIIDLGIDIDLSSAVTVQESYQEATDYSCVEGVECNTVWVGRVIDLTENIDYIVDYDKNQIRLKNPLPPDDTTHRNYAVRVICREDIGQVIAEYKYYVPHTNKVEDIVKDLAKKVGFKDTDLQSTEQEFVYSRDNFNYQLSHKGVINMNWIKVDGQTYTGDYNLLSSSGLLELEVGCSEAIIDPFDTLYKMTHSDATTISLDSNGVIGNCVKAVMQANNYISKDYHYWGIYLDLHYFKEVSFMVKPSVDLDHLTLEVIDSNWDSHMITSSNSLKANQWNEAIFNISGITTLDQVLQLRLWTPSAVTMYVDYLHTPKHSVEVSYNYSTVEATGISASESHYLKEEVDNYKAILQDVMKLLPPSYRLYVDRNGILHGKDLKMPFYYILPLIYSRDGLESDDFYGKFLIPDYSLTLMSSFSHNISTEQLYNAVEVIGKKAYMEDVAMMGSVEDECSVVSGVVYGNAPSKDKAIIDGDMSSGIYWYIQQRNNANPPFNKDQYMIKLTLSEPIYWTEIILSIGAYQNKVIRNEYYIEVETPDGERFYPEDTIPTRKQGQTGTHLKFANKRFKYKKIKYVYIYGSTPFYWFTSKQAGGGKK